MYKKVDALKAEIAELEEREELIVEQFKRTRTKLKNSQLKGKVKAPKKLKGTDRNSLTPRHMGENVKNSRAEKEPKSCNPCNLI